MARTTLFDLARTGRGEYKRTLGKTAPDLGKQTFYLGYDHATACQNVLKLEQAWEAVCLDWSRHRDQSCACWDDTTLPIAKAIARGKTVVSVPFPIQADDRADDAFAIRYKAFYARLGSLFPMIQIEAANAELHGMVDESLLCDQKVAEAHGTKAKNLEILRRGTATDAGEKLSAALDGYSAYCAKKYVQPDGTATDFGGLVQRRINNIKQQLASRTATPLAKMNAAFIEEWLLQWGNRPQGMRGQPLSPAWCQGVIKTIRDFLRWLNRSEFNWTRPSAYEVLPIRIKNTEAETGGVKQLRYTSTELAALWEYALPLDRVYLLLGLNCGFGKGEIGNLWIAEIVTKGDKTFIVRRRRKTNVFGQWLLWPETVTALRWYLEKVRPQSNAPYVFLTKAGTPFNAKTKGGHPCQSVPNAWMRTWTRIAKDLPDFPRLSFNKLRKTGSNYLRKKFGKEVAEMYLSHGKHEMVDHYTAKPVALLYKALRRLHKALSPMFAKVEAPFPEVNRKSNPSVSLATQKRVKALRASGYTWQGISNKLKLSIQTVRRYGK
jgi:hypothetical protein